MRGSALTLSCLGFLLGVSVSTIAPLSTPEALFFFLVAGAFLVLSALFGSKERGRYLAAALLCLAFGVGVIRELDVARPPEAELRQAIGHSARIEGVILEEPAQRQNATRLVVRADIMRYGKTTAALESNVLVFAERSFSLAYGDRVRVDGVLAEPEVFVTESGRIFDYPGYLEAKGIAVIVEHPRVEVLARGEGNQLRETLFSIKRAFLDALARALPEPESTLLAGLLLGSQGALPEEVEESFRVAGLSHIVVLSGYNITLVADAAMKIFSFLPLLVRLVSGSVAIILFVLMVGGSAAAVRAAIMAILVLAARGTGRTYAAGRALLLAGTTMVVFDPRILLGDVSFQLSFLATAGLIYGSPILELLLKRLPDMYGVKALAVSTLSAQLFVLPLILYHSGILSVVALPANLAVLPSVPIAMFLGAILGGVALLSTALAIPLSFVAGLVLKYEISAANFFAALPGSHFLVPEFSSLLLVSVYALGACGLVLWHRLLMAEPRSASPARSSSDS